MTSKTITAMSEPGDATLHWTHRLMQLGQPVDDSQGPCVACGAIHTRYGQHGNPLCPDCK